MSVRRFDVYCNGGWDGCTTYEDDNDLGDYVTFEDFAAMEAKYNALWDAAVHVYNSGYHAGHHDTVEGCYVDIHPIDMGTYHAEEVVALLAALVGEE